MNQRQLLFVVYAILLSTLFTIFTFEFAVMIALVSIASDVAYLVRK